MTKMFNFSIDKLEYVNEGAVEDILYVMGENNFGVPLEGKLKKIFLLKRKWNMVTQEDRRNEAGYLMYQLRMMFWITRIAYATRTIHSQEVQINYAQEIKLPSKFCFKQWFRWVMGLFLEHVGVPTVDFEEILTFNYAFRG